MDPNEIDIAPRWNVHAFWWVAMGAILLVILTGYRIAQSLQGAKEGFWTGAMLPLLGALTICDLVISRVQSMCSRITVQGGVLTVKTPLRVVSWPLSSARVERHRSQVLGVTLTSREENRLLIRLGKRRFLVPDVALKNSEKLSVLLARWIRAEGGTSGERSESVKWT